MSGIFGYFAQDIHEDILNDIVGTIKDEDYCITDQILNRSCVLCKLDIKFTKIKKVITKEEDKISIVTVGEVYNEDVGNLDQSILKLYEEERLDKLKNFNGSFVAAIYDGTEDKLTVVNDRYGLIKLFYYRDESLFYFAPKIKPLLKLGAKKSLRKDAIIDFSFLDICLEIRHFLSTSINFHLRRF